MPSFVEGEGEDEEHDLGAGQEVWALRRKPAGIREPRSGALEYLSETDAGAGGSSRTNNLVELGRINECSVRGAMAGIF